MSTKQTPNEVEEVKDLEQVEEVQDLAEAPEEVKEVQDLTEVPEEVKEAPVPKSGGMRDAADPNMIQTHLDNFLAKIAGETPVDGNVRTSKEYWLNRIAGIIPDNLGKKLYYHPVGIYSNPSGTPVYGVSIGLVIINDSATKFTSADQFREWVTSNNITYICPASGSIYNPVTQKTLIVSWIDFASGVWRFRGHYIDSVSYLDMLELTNETVASEVIVSDSGVNRIL